VSLLDSLLLLFRICLPLSLSWRVVSHFGPWLWVGTGPTRCHYNGIGKHSAWGEHRQSWRLFLWPVSFTHTILNISTPFIHLTSTHASSIGRCTANLLILNSSKTVFSSSNSRSNVRKCNSPFGITHSRGYHYPLLATSALFSTNTSKRPNLVAFQILLFSYSRTSLHLPFVDSKTTSRPNVATLLFT